jgi:hypothetical protein
VINAADTTLLWSRFETIIIHNPFPSGFHYGPIYCKNNKINKQPPELQISLPLSARGMQNSFTACSKSHPIVRPQLTREKKANQK